MLHGTRVNRVGEPGDLSKVLMVTSLGAAQNGEDERDGNSWRGLVAFR